MTTSVDECLIITISNHGIVSSSNLDQEPRKYKRARTEASFGPNLVITLLNLLQI